MTEHTPGPWGTAHWKGSSNTAVLAENGGCVARTFSPLGGTHADAKANARLIAAAPDLLAALEDMVGQYVAFVSQGMSQVPEGPGREQYLAEHGIRTYAADAAIKKARGKA